MALIIVRVLNNSISTKIILPDIRTTSNSYSDTFSNKVEIKASIVMKTICKLYKYLLIYTYTKNIVYIIDENLEIYNIIIGTFKGCVNYRSKISFYIILVDKIKCRFKLQFVNTKGMRMCEISYYSKAI